jgi:hypothetical protein
VLGLRPRLPTSFDEIVEDFLRPLAALLLVSIGWLCVESLYQELRLPYPFAKILVSLEFKESWRLFEDPGEMRNDWLVIPGKLHDGTKVDLARGGAPVDWAEPALPSAMYPHRRIWLFMLRATEEEELWPPLGGYFCRTWNATHQGAVRLDEVEIVSMEEDPLPEGSLGPPHPVPRWKGACPP